MRPREECTCTRVEPQQRLNFPPQDDIARENEKAKERIKQQVIDLSLRSAEKILRQKLDEPAQRRLAGEFIDEVEALR